MVTSSSSSPRPLPSRAAGAGGASDAAERAADFRADTGRAGRVGLWALALGLGGFLLWAAFAPLDEGVPAQGVVAIDTKRKAVQHLSGGIVKEVLVREGDHVTDGQTVLRLDEAVARSNFEAARQRYLGLRAMEGRLQAEQAGQSTIRFHPDLEAAASDPLIRQQMQTQQQLLNARAAALQADLASIDESIQGQQALLESYRGILASRQSQQSLIAEELKSTRPLVAEGYAPRNRQLELERMVAESNAATTELQGNIVRAQRAINELRQKAVARRLEQRKEVESQMADVQREVQSDEQKFRAVRDDLGRMEVKATATGQVVGLAVQTVGGVIQPGQKIMDVVPGDEPLLLEVKVAPHLIDRVHAGMPVDVRFSSFANTPQLVVHGKVLSVSGDLLTEPNGMTYYLARATVTPEGMKQLGKRQMQPGMPVEVVLKTGERSLLTYLLHPLTKRLAASMKEE